MSLQELSLPTVPAWIHYGQWNEETRKHPAMRWFEEYTKDTIDARKFDKSWDVHHTSDFRFHKPDGTTAHGGEHAWSHLASIYDEFTEHHHEGVVFVLTDRPEGGWWVLGLSNFFANLAKKPHKHHKKIKDSTGKEWDITSPRAYHFEFVPDPKADGGIKICTIKVVGDAKLPAAT